MAGAPPRPLSTSSGGRPARPNCLHRHDLPHQRLADRAGAFLHDRRVPRQSCSRVARLVSSREKAQIVLEAVRSPGVGIDRLPEFLLGIPPIGLAAGGGLAAAAGSAALTPNWRSSKAPGSTASPVSPSSPIGPTPASCSPAAGRSSGGRSARTGGCWTRPAHVGDIPPASGIRNSGWSVVSGPLLGGPLFVVALCCCDGTVRGSQHV